MAEKTEKATPKKLRDARKKGQVAKSQDLPSAFTFIVSIASILTLSSWLYLQISSVVASHFKLITRENIAEILPALYYQAFPTIVTICLPIMLLVCFIGVVVNFLAIGPMFAPEVFKPDIKKFDPVKNLKAKFKLKTLFELVKSLFKVSVAAYIIYSVMYKSLPVLTTAVSMPIEDALMIFYYFLVEVVIKVGIFFIAVAVLDFVYQKYNFANEMKMEKFEVKQEYKNTEGDPQIKSKRKQIAQEIAYQDGPSAGVKKAKAVVTNPTHYAVAIAYDREIDQAPYMIAQGKDQIAKLMIKVAEENNIPVVRNIELTHKLWEEGDLYDYIPEDSFEAVAEILRWIESLNSGKEFGYVEE